MTISYSICLKTIFVNDSNNLRFRVWSKGKLHLFPTLLSDLFNETEYCKSLNHHSYVLTMLYESVALDKQYKTCFDAVAQTTLWIIWR